MSSTPATNETPTKSGVSTNDSNNNNRNNNNSGNSSGNRGRSNNNKNNGRGGSNNNNNGRGDGNSNRRNLFSANERSWGGDKPDIGAVLGLRSEYLDKKHSFCSFLEKLVEYVLHELNNPNDVLELLTEQKDPRPGLKANMPVKLDDTDKNNEVLVAIQQQRIKMYVMREMELETNILKIYGLIKGQCSYSLLSILKQDNKYEAKNRKQDALWLMQKVKSLTSGLDNKSNKCCNLFDALFAFITMKQGETESDVSYMKRFRVNLDTLISSGGKHILYSPELVEAKDKSNITKKEKELEH